MQRFEGSNLHLNINIRKMHSAFLGGNCLIWGGGEGGGGGGGRGSSLYGLYRYGFLVMLV